MRVRLPRTLAIAALVGLLLVQGGAGAGTARAFGYNSLTPTQQRLLSGLASYELSRAAAQPASKAQGNYYPAGDDGCPQERGPNVKVNQNCLNLADPDLQGRGQAQNETAIAQDPRHPEHLVAGFNDYRRGDGNCGAAFSVDAGANWADSTVPTSFTRGADFGAARQYWGGGGDTSVAWDTRGNAYLSCQVFNRGLPTSANPDLSSALLVFRSTQNHGASWNFPGRYVRASADLKGTGAAAFLDKQYMTVDNRVGSPFQDRVYVTWTEFAADGTGYIYGAYSADFAEHFSAPHLVSTDSPVLCPNTYGLGTPQGNCNENQYSQPFTGPDGALYVVYINYNNATGRPVGEPDEGGGGPNATAVDPNDNRNQLLLVKSTDGGATFGPPVKVADFYDLPDCATYQGGKDPGRACIPEQGPTTNSYFRASNYPSGAASPTDPGRIAIAFGSYINQYSQEANGCAPAGFSPATGQNLYTGVKLPGACSNHILASVSADGGKTFTGTATDPRSLPVATQEDRQRTTDQFWQWAAFTRDGVLAVSYYDRQYGDDETTGFSDVSLSGSADLLHFGTRRVTSAAMPPPTQFEGLFFGDYSGLTAVDRAYPLWMDTRSPALFLCPGGGTTVCRGSATNAEFANDQDVYTRGVEVPKR
jgi:hypothetical protein